MAVTLLVRSGVCSGDGSADGPLAITLDLPRIVLGRGEGCDVCVPDRSISHRHASLRQRGADYLIVDEGSTNGTFLGAVRLHPQSPRVIRHGQLIRLGRVWVEFRIEQIAPDTQSVQATRELAIALMCRTLHAQGEVACPRLIATEGPDLGKQIDLSEPMRPLVLGRARDADLQLEVSDASRRHAQILRKGDHALVRDLGSRNGTHTSAGPIPVDRDIVMRHGDSIQIGPDVFVFEHPAVEALKDLAHGSDEPVSPQEAPPPPDLTTSQPPPASGSPDERDEALPDVRERAEPDESPRLSDRRPKAAARGGWGKTDVVIVLFAVLVFGLSVLGILWLVRAS